MSTTRDGVGSYAAPIAIPASSTEGFFQDKPILPNSLRSDLTLRRVFDFFLPLEIQNRISVDLTKFSALCNSSQIRRNTINAEAHHPYVRTWNMFGHRQDELITSEGWRNSTSIATEEGIVSIGYETDKWGQYARVYQFIKTHLWSANSCGVTCPSAMQDGAAALLSRHVHENSETPEGTKAVFREALRRLLSRDPAEAWTSGQWMTERPGGSDVRNTETRATLAGGTTNAASETASDGSPLGPWRINGFKWFSSATDANMTVLLAKTGDSEEISAFFAPTKKLVSASSDGGDGDGKTKQDLQSNGIQIQRLKNKLGTKPLPTAELVLDNMRAHLLGQVGTGTKEISSILNITRIHTAVGAVGGWGRGLAISRAYSTVRRSSGRLLMHIPAHIKGLAEQHVQYRAYMGFTYFVVSLLGIVETDAETTHLAILPSAYTASMLLRLCTPVLKSQASLSAIAGLRFCMESLGGVGYLENEDSELNVARIFRDANVLSIWEGTTDVLASDTVRVVKGRQGDAVLETLQAWTQQALGRWSGQQHLGFVGDAGLNEQLQDLMQLVHNSSVETLLYHGRELMERIAWIVCSVVLVEDALRDGDAVALEVAKRWMLERPQAGRVWTQSAQSWKREAEWNSKIVFGDDLNPRDTSKL